jgi:hypothetical protein
MKLISPEDHDLGEAQAEFTVAADPKHASDIDTIPLSDLTALPAVKK